MRRLVSRVYSMDSMRDLELYAEKTVARLMMRLEERQGQIVDMGLWMQLFAFGRKTVISVYSTII